MLLEIIWGHLDSLLLCSLRVYNNSTEFGWLFFAIVTKKVTCFCLFNRLLSDISRLETKVERLETQLSAKDREIASMTRTVRALYYFERSTKLSLSIFIFGFTPNSTNRKRKLQQLSKSKLISCSKSEMNFRRWCWVTRSQFNLFFLLY